MTEPRLPESIERLMVELDGDVYLSAIGERGGLEASQQFAASLNALRREIAAALEVRVAQFYHDAGKTFLAAGNNCIDRAAAIREGRDA